MRSEGGRSVWAITLFLAAIGIAVAVRRLLLLASGAPAGPAAIFYGALFLFALAKAYVEIRAGRVALHREWMIRAFAIGLAAAAIRPIIGFFFATSRLTHLTPREFFGPAFWIGFTAMTAAAEGWIRYTRPVARTEESAPTS